MKWECEWRWNYVIIPLITLVVALGGSYITGGGMEWYRTLHVPSFTPPGQAIGLVWTIIYLLATAAALLVWNRPERTVSKKREKEIGGAFLGNAILNLGWSFLFFGRHLIGPAILEAVALELSVVLLILLVYRYSRPAALLLAPYALWVGFATYLTYSVWMLN